MPTLAPRISKNPAKVYSKYEDSIREAVEWFAWKYGGDVAELFSWTGPMFMIAFNDYDRSRGPFNKYVKWVVTKGLLDIRIANAKRHARCPTMDLDPDSFIAPRPFPLLEFMDSLSEDGRTVAKLALFTPHQLAINTLKRGGKPATLRGIIREYLVYAGWEITRVNRTFEEIRKAL